MASNDSIHLPAREDNSTVDAEKVVAWARKFPGVDAHIILNYITPGTGESVPGSLNGVTIQWDHDNDGNPDHAVHAVVGSTITRTVEGFEVTA